MLLEFFGLRDQPFGVTPDPRFLYSTPSHREALTALMHGIEAGRGFMTLIAKPGMGKTTLLFDLLEQCRSSARTAFLFQTQCDSREFLSYLLTDLGIDAHERDVAHIHSQLNQALASEARTGRRVVLFIDEAQNLDESVLETVRLMSDFETPHSKLIQIVLAGHLSLIGKLASPALRQRISVRTRLKPLTVDEVGCYIDYRLSVAGYSAASQGALFTTDAQRLLAVESEGIPRNINNLCFHAMNRGFALSQKTIDADIIRDVLTDLEENLHTAELNVSTAGETACSSAASILGERLMQGDSATGDYACSFRTEQAAPAEFTRALTGTGQDFRPPHFNTTEWFSQVQAQSQPHSSRLGLTGADWHARASTPVLLSASSGDGDSSPTPDSSAPRDSDPHFSATSSTTLIQNPIHPTNGVVAAADESSNWVQAGHTSSERGNGYEPESEIMVAENRVEAIRLKSVVVHGNVEADTAAQHVGVAERDWQAKKERNAAYFDIVSRITSQLEQQISTALEEFSQKARARLRSLEEEHLADMHSKLQAQFTAESERQMGEIQATAHQRQAELGAIAEQVGSLLANNDFVSRLEQARDGAEKASQRAETAAKGLNQAVEEGLNKIERASQQLDAQLKETADSVRKIGDDLLRSSPSRLEKQADEFAELLQRKLGSSQAAIVSETNAKFAVNSRSSLEYLTKEADAIAAEFRHQLEQSAKAYTLTSAPQVEPHTTALAEQQTPARKSETQAHKTGRRESPWRAVFSATLPSGRLGVAATWLVAIAPAFVVVFLSIFVFLSIQPQRQLRAAPPAEFFEVPEGNTKRRVTEERLALAYWQSAVQKLQQKYTFRAKLPDDPPPEFGAEGTAVANGTLKIDPTARSRYWRKLRQTWASPSAWEDSYVWNTKWVQDILQKL